MSGSYETLRLEFDDRGVARITLSWPAVDHVLRHDDPTNRLYTADRLADAWKTEEGKEGIRAFLDKRAPAWRPHG